MRAVALCETRRAPPFAGHSSPRAACGHESTCFVLSPNQKIPPMKNRTDTAAETPEQLIEHISRLMTEAEAMISGPVTEQATGKLAEMRERLEAARDQLAEAYGR